MQYTAMIIPVILFLILVEYLAAYYFGKENYFKFEKSISNISIGIAERFSYLLFAIIYYEIFNWIYIEYAIMEIPNNVFFWIILLLLTDLLWYWYHRFGHEINLLWSAHIVHHQSDDFNFTTAARITFFQAVIRNVFWCVLPFMGFHPNMVITILLVHGGYSFFTHTRMIGKLGFLEKILITPSHHRVHHASNAKYLDKNYGDVFVIWDKMFDTFQEEDEEPVFGLVTPLDSNSFLWQHFHFYFEMYEAISLEKSWIKRFKILFGKPIVINEEHRILARKRFHQESINSNLSPFQKIYLTVQTGLGLLILYLASYNYLILNWIDLTFISLFLFLSLILIGSLIEKKEWNFNLEILRIYIGIFWVFWAMNYDLTICLFLSIIVILFFLPMRKLYDKQINN